MTSATDALPTDTQTLLTDWLAALERELPAAAELRRVLHREPRASGDERETTERVAAAMDLEFEPVADTGGIGRLGPDSGPAIGMRGELDALPVTEATGVEWASTNGCMHACGHDVHLAALTAVVRAARDLPLPYALVPVLQPREEAYPSGAADIVEEPAFARAEIAHMFGAHVHPGVPVGAVATGRGGHGAYPHHGDDVAGAVAQIISGIPATLRRTVDPMHSAVVSVGTVRVGSGAANVLPASGEILATIRTASSDEARRLADVLRDFVAHQASAFGCTGTLEHVEGEPELVNDEALVAELDGLLDRVGLDHAEPMRSLGADDFSFFGTAVPSVMTFVGVDGGGVSLHDATFLPDEHAIERVAKTFIAGYLAAARRLDGATP
jgi:amidohydrolase